MAGHAVGVVQALGVVGACRGLGIVEKPGQRSGDGPDDHEGGEEAEQGPAHGWQDTTRALTSVAPTCRVLAQRSVGGRRCTTSCRSLQRANIHTFARFGFPPEEKYQTFEGALEMGSLQGSVIGSEVHAHVTFYHWDTRASMVGHLDPGTQVAYMAEVTLVEIEGVRAERFRDAVGDYRVRDLTRVAVHD